MVAALERAGLLREFERVRALSLRLCEPLAAADFRVQAMPDQSPPFWNLGHTSWFFARNVLQPAGLPVEGFPGFDYVFNSYYEGLGPRLPRAQRGGIAAPATEEVLRYRGEVDRAMANAIAELPAAQLGAFAAATAIGLQHEQQHQELLLTEILYLRASVPAALRRPYLPALGAPGPHRDPSPLSAVDFAGGVTEIGHRGDGFCWDNELPVHRAHVGDFALGDRLITNGEWSAFVDDGGYRRPLLWLSNGWEAVQQQGWQAPLHWERRDGAWWRFTLRGDAPVDPAAAVCHVSFHEAYAFAQWYGEQFRAWRHARLPFEREWEHAARRAGFDGANGNLLGDDPAGDPLDATPAPAAGSSLRQLCGCVWEWTLSHYEPYPGYRPFPGALTEYNGKFMDNQRVLRGGSFATPRSSARIAYRNFWPAATRFQATGVRLLRE